MSDLTLMIQAARARQEKANAEVSALCHGAKWTMRIPANPEQDSDLVIGAALRDASKLLEVVVQARFRIAEQPLGEDFRKQIKDLLPVDAAQLGYSLAVMRWEAALLSRDGEPAQEPGETAAAEEVKGD